MATRPYEYGFSCEFMSPKEILEFKVPEKMQEHNFGLFLKLFDDGLDAQYKQLLQTCQDLDVYHGFFPWPLLKVEDGYYPNEFTVDKFREQVKKLCSWTAENGFDQPPYILVDLEPSADPSVATNAEEVREKQLQRLRDPKGVKQAVADETAKAEKKAKSGGLDVMGFVGKLIDMIDENVDEDRFMENSQQFNELVDTMHDYGTKALAVALPWTFDDLKDGRYLVQDFMTVPIHTVNWDMVNYMCFSTDIVDKTKGVVTHDEFCHLLYSYAKDFKQYHESRGAQGSICCGITNYGIQDTSAIQVDPELYRKEFDAVIAGGLDQLGIYALEGVLVLDDPDAFFETVGSASGDFTPDPEKLECATMVRRLFEGLDYIAPVLKFLVDSGKVMNIIQAATSGGGLF